MEKKENDPVGVNKDHYKSFGELVNHEREGKDFRIIKEPRNSKVLIMALHGGGIEPGTMQVAMAIAGSAYSLYGFEGLKPKGNQVLHITSTNYDEPAALTMADDASIVLTVHGFHEGRECAVLGGLHEVIKEKIFKGLRAHGFLINPPYAGDFPAEDSSNICNKGKSGRGVQMELSGGLREKLLVDEAQFSLFSKIIQKALSSVEV